MKTNGKSPFTDWPSVGKERSRVHVGFWRRRKEGPCAAVFFMSVSRISHELSLYHMAKEENYKSDRSGIFKK